MLRFQRLTRRSSALMYVSPSELIEIELMWYACALAYTLRGTAATIVSWYVMRGRRRYGAPFGSRPSPFLSPPPEPPSDDERPGTAAPPGGGDDGALPPAAAELLFSATTLSDFSNTFHSLIVLSAGGACATSARAYRGDVREEGEGRTVGRQEEVGGVLALAPPDLVDLLLDLERLEVIELGLVRLELGVELVLAPLLVLVALKQDDAAALVARREVVARVVKLDAGCGRATMRQGQRVVHCEGSAACW